MTDRAWFSHLLTSRHPTRKLAGSVLSTPEPAQRVRYYRAHDELKSAQRDTNLRAGTLQPDRTF